MTAARVYPDDDFPADQVQHASQNRLVGGETSTGQATSHSTPSSGAPVRPSIPASQRGSDAQRSVAGGDPNSEQAIVQSTPSSGAPARPNSFLADQGCNEAQLLLVGEEGPSSSGQPAVDTQNGCAAAPQSPGPAMCDAQPKVVPLGPVTQAPEQSIEPPAPKGRATARAQTPPTPATENAQPIGHPPVLADPLPPSSTITRPAPRGPASAAGDSNVLAPASDRPMPTCGAPGPAPQAQPAPARPHAQPSHPPPVLADPLLALAADVLDDLERVRIANENRLRQLTRAETDSDGINRGFGLPADHPDVARLAALVDGLGQAEHQAELNLRRLLRRHPLGPWSKAARGVGEKQAARLLASIGDPYIRPQHTLQDGTVEPARPRRVSELWSYTGYGDVTRQVRRRGERVRWNPTAKKFGFLVAESCMKQLVPPCHVVKGDKGEYLHAVHVDGCACSPYRVVYDAGRDRYRDTIHPSECVRCGPKGHPAETGSPRSAAHQQQCALRLATKAFLRDLWREARRLHEEGES